MRWAAALAVVLSALVPVGTASTHAFGAPVVTVPSDMTVEATAASGAIVDFSASAVDDSGTSLSVTCAPPSGGTFALGGPTTVTCSATDSAGTTASSTFGITVVDTTAPAFGALPDVTAEATGSGGQPVDYTTPTASDAVSGDIAASCAPASGTLFALGPPTSVTCTATDGQGNTGSASFQVTVADTTPPTVAAPADLSVRAPTSEGIVATDPAVASFLAGVTATDTIDPSPVITNDAPAALPVGTTVVTFSARDASGNVGQATASVEVLPPLPPPPPPSSGGSTSDAPTAEPPPPAIASVAPDTTAPPEVANLVVSARSNVVVLQWAPSPARDFAHFLVTRQRPDGVLTIYTGQAPSVADKAVKNGLSYTYLVRACDTSGNCTAGVSVVAQPRAISLLQPASNARVTSPPRLVWLPAPKTRYYNVQLFRDGKKVLSVWPGTHSLQLTRSWTYLHKTIHFAPGTYTWYVWPGMGSHRARRYGPLLGSSSFTVPG